MGYQRYSLGICQRGETFYLQGPLRGQLHERERNPARERPAGTSARDIQGRLPGDVLRALFRLEGSTCSRLDTQNLIELGQVAKGKEAIETQMILNHKAAIEMLVGDVDEAGLDAFNFAFNFAFTFALQTHLRQTKQAQPIRRA